MCRIAILSRMPQEGDSELPDHEWQREAGQTGAGNSSGPARYGRDQIGRACQRDRGAEAADGDVDPALHVQALEHFIHALR